LLNSGIGWNPATSGHRSRIRTKLAEIWKEWLDSGQLAEIWQERSAFG
jgi:hypothetical protein